MATCDSTAAAAASPHCLPPKGDNPLPFEGRNSRGFPTYWNVVTTGRMEEDVAIGRFYAEALIEWMRGWAQRNEADAVCLLGWLVEEMRMSDAHRSLRIGFFTRLSAEIVGWAGRGGAA